MGTFGTGPMDNDNALDLKDTLADRGVRGEGCMTALIGSVHQLARFDSPQDGEDVHQLVQTGIGGCAVIADKVCGTYFYLMPPEDGEDLRLDMLPELDPEFRETACRAVARAMDLQDHPEMPAWGSPESAWEHSLALEELATRLHGHTEEK